MCLNIHLDFYYEETQIQSMICDLTNEIKNSEESKIDQCERKSKDLSEQRIELDKGSDLTKCKHQIDILILIEKVEYLLILLNHISCL